MKANRHELTGNDDAVTIGERDSSRAFAGVAAQPHIEQIQRVNGTLREETPTHVVVVTGTPAAEQRIAKSDIAERTNPVSAMPPVGLVLKPREVRDVVAYLATLR